MSFAARVRQALPLRIQPVARYYYETWRGLLERELPLFLELIRPDDHVIDVGANFGIYVHGLRRRGARVEAFEPQPYCADVLRAYAGANPSVSVHQMALGAGPATAKLEVPVVNGRIARGSASLSAGPSRAETTATARVAESVPVMVRALDSFAFTDVRAVKIDVEGGELDVIEGSKETLRRCRPTMLIEVEQRHHTDPIDRVFSQIEAHGYRASFLLPGEGLRPVSEFRVEMHQREAALRGSGGPYINNFFFHPV